MKKQFISYPKIGQYRNAVADIKHQFCFKEKDDEGNVIYDLNAEIPKLTAYGTTKIHGCVSYDTVLETENGQKTIKEIVDNNLKDKIKTLNVETNEIEYCEIYDWFFKEKDGDWYEIELENGKKIKITGNNPVWLPNIHAYRRVDELEEGDEIVFCE